MLYNILIFYRQRSFNMADIYSVLNDIVNGLNATLTDCGFTAVIPNGVEKGDLPAVTDSGRIIIEYKGENKGKRPDFDKTGILSIAQEFKGQGSAAAAQSVKSAKKEAEAP